MAVHVFSQKIKKLLYDCDLFQYYAGYIFGHVLCCFRRKRNMFLSNDNGYMHISLSVDRLDMYFIFSLLNMSIPNRVTIFPWCPATSIQLITFFGSGMYVSLKRDVFCGSKKFIKQTLSQIRELHSTFIVRQQEMLTSTNLSSNGSFRALKFNTA